MRAGRTGWLNAFYAACWLGTGLLAGGCSATGAPASHVHARSVERMDRVFVSPGVIAGARSDTGPFDEALLSWDIGLSPGVAARLEARVGRGETRSEWLTIATRGDRETPFDRPPLRRSGPDRVDVDMIVCETPADAIEWRIVGVGDGAVRVDAVWVTTTAIGAGGTLDASTPEPVSHAVIHKAQREGGEELGGRLCSPTAVAMVVASQGIEIGVAEMAERVLDHEFDLYGNWVNNTLAASELGVPMRLTRIGSWPEARAYIQRGPIVISLPPFDEHELVGAGYSSGSGHLIVLRGFDESGDVLVRDPAHERSEDAARTYRLDDLTRLWLIENKGTAYVLAAPSGE
jgi:hypothetical protein